MKISNFPFFCETEEAQLLEEERNQHTIENPGIPGIIMTIRVWFVS